MSLFERLGQLILTHQVSLTLDVGAHVGDFSASLRTISNFKGPILAFEPLEEAFKTLSERTAHDPLLQCHNIALGPQSGAALLNVTRNFYSSSLLLPTDKTLAIESGVVVTHKQSITVRALDDLAAQLGLNSERIFLKMDAQGFEREILEGAAKTLESVVLLLVELSFFQTYQGGWKLIDALPDLYRRGFRVVGCEEGWTNSKTGEVLEGDFVLARGLVPI